MKQSRSAPLLFAWLLCLCSVIRGSPVPTTQGPQDGDCPSSCALVFHHSNSTAEISLHGADQDGLSMASRELNPQYYEASRARQALQHYVNTVHGSPFRLYSVSQVHEARTEYMGDAGMKYILEVSVGSGGESSACSAEVLYPRGEAQHPPQVQCSCDKLPKSDISDKERDFFQRYSDPSSAVFAKDIPDSYGHVDPDMVPFWHLGILASSHIMLNESNEKTLYNMAQVAQVKQLKCQDDQLRFEYEVLLHDMVSQEIIRWKLQITWSPEKGLKVLESELLPRCHCS